jgi:hypothetical protein
MMYFARFQTLQGYCETIDHVSFEGAIKFLNRQIQVHTDYTIATIQEHGNGKEVFSYRTVK